MRTPKMGGCAGLRVACAALFLLLLGTFFTAAAGAPKRGGTLHLGFPEDFKSLDPAFGFTINTMPVQRILFESLLDMDDDNQVIPWAAREWRISADQKTYTLRLQPNLRFSTGRPVVAADYVYSIERILDPKTASLGQSYFSSIRGQDAFRKGQTNHVAGLRAPAPDVLEIDLEQPQFTFRFVLCMVFTAAVPREAVESPNSRFSQRPVGSGPYLIKEYQRDVGYRLERNPHYSRLDTAYVDSVEIMIGGDRTLEAMMFDQGELDMVPDLRVTDYFRYRRHPVLNQRLVMVPMASTDYVFLNNEIKPFDDVRVRRALNHAVNKRRLVQLANPAFPVAKGILPPTMPGYDPNLTDYAYDPEQAKRLLAEAGLAGGFRTQFYYGDSVPHWKRLCMAIAEDWSQVGVHADLIQLSAAAMDDAYTTRHKIPCGYYGWVQDYPDPSDFLDVLLNGEGIVETGCNNQAFYNNPQVNAALKEAGNCVDPPRRNALYGAIEKTILRDAPWIPILHPLYPTVVQPWVKGFKPHPVWLYRYETLWIER